LAQLAQAPGQRLIRRTGRPTGTPGASPDGDTTVTELPPADHAVTSLAAHINGWSARRLPWRLLTGGARMSRTRVVIADDDVLLREGLATLLERSGFEVPGRAGDASELLELVRRHLPDLVVVDIRMPPTYSTEGLDAAQAIRQELPETAILVLSAHVEVEHAMHLLASGGRVGYLLKSRVADVDEFMYTLRRIAGGGSVVDPALVQELVGARRRHDPLATLSEREREVLSLVAEGRSNAGVARRLWVTEGTVEKHVRSILTKLGLPETNEHHRRVLAVLAYLDSTP
jgi:DNA-binding NarL/FixJ family response regulator